MATDARNPGAPRRSIVLVASTSIYLANSRLGLLRRLLADGWRVIVASPHEESSARLVAVGVDWRPLAVSREIARPVQHWRLMRALTRLYREEQPDVVHHFTSNPVIYGTMAAEAARVPAVVNALPGLGSVFQSSRWDAPALRAWLRWAYRRVHRYPNCRTIFQNADDRDAFVELGLVPARQTIVIRGSGVDTELFGVRPELPGVPTVLFCGRMLRFKGIEDLVGAARLLRVSKVRCHLRLVGPCDPRHADALAEAQLLQWQAEGLLRWDGYREDTASVYSESHIVALPSHGGEGVPRSLIEAAACGRPLVATDVTGCREIVRHGQNGLLVPPGDPQRLAQALARLIDDASERQRFGQAGRTLVVREFAESAVIDATVDTYLSIMRS